ncbi:hypothetical protein DPMN_159988 [Dreissena polymorpha]|uniref:Uncharacterized protein n=1 Tax=Dreissena polymorpha TaxID=45954 RepID=A0A9D4IR94_DREPO|nr:hypothetical protein DPMN_159988 [Dreissena polymorpha]
MDEETHGYPRLEKHPNRRNGQSPTRHLMFRRTRNKLPIIADELLKPKVVENVRHKKMLKHQHSKFQYDKGAKDLQELGYNDNCQTCSKHRM